MREVVPFAAVPAGLASALEGKGFTSLTSVQEAILSPELRGRDLRISSQTGSGKTVAIGFVLADELEGIERGTYVRGQAATPRALLVAPTRELAAQIGVELSWLYQPLRAYVAVVTGGNAIVGDFRALQSEPHVVVGTPGRLVDHLRRGTLDLSATRAIVLDEADEMLDMGFREELDFIVEATPKNRRTHLVSATLPRPVLQLAKRYQHDAARVEGTQAGVANTDIKHIGYLIRTGDRLGALTNILLAAAEKRSLVFCRTRSGTAELASELRRKGFSATALSGEMSQRERTAALQAFKDNAVRIVVATDVAARGLQIDDVGQIIHYDLPENPEVYTHRSGRTARAGQKGISIAFVPPSWRGRLEQIQRRAGITMEFKPLPTAEDIRIAADTRLMADLYHSQQKDVANQALTSLATRLLKAGDPVAIVAGLLARVDHSGPCEPAKVKELEDRSTHYEGRKPAKRFTNGRGSKWGRDGRAHSGGAGESRAHSGGAGESRAPRRERSVDYTRFHINWGAAAGANPSRLLAMVCRRGNIRSDSVGAIKIGPHRSTVELASSVAEQFARDARLPDTRNPKIKIRPWSDDVAKKSSKPARMRT